MSSVNRPHRKATDEEIVRLNSLGLSAVAIGKAFGMHPSSVLQRLKGLGVPPVDARRSFMQDVVLNLTDEQALWLSNQLGPRTNIKTFITNLIVEKYIKDPHRHG